MVRRQRQTRKWMVAATSVLLLVLAVAAVAYFLLPANPANKPFVTPAPTSTPVEPAGLRTLTDHYMAVMHSLNSSQMKTEMTKMLNPTYNQTDLFAWQKARMVFENPAGMTEDPLQILGDHKGICYQWSIVYVSACLSLGYPSRLVASTDTANYQAIHMWAEVYYNAAWIHVDPSDGIWNNPSKYLGWEWGKGIGSTVKVYAFMDGAFQDVTATYGPSPS
jgi:hypothetical protein